MPPRARGGGGRGSARGGAPRGDAPRRGAPLAAGALPPPNSHVTTIGVKRTSYGTNGRVFPVYTNHFKVDIPEAIIHHYDVVILPSEKTLPARVNMELIQRLQTVVAPEVFTPPAVYDGRKNLFAARELPFGESKAREFSFTRSDPAPGDGQQETDKPQDGNRKRGPTVYKVRLKWVASINPVVLSRFLEGKQSHDNDVLTAITALNVVIRMEPTLKYPFNVRSFFTPDITKDIGAGIILWRGYFQSIRPAVGKMLINVDITTGTMYQPGKLIDLCKNFLNLRNNDGLNGRRLSDRDRIRLQRFLLGVRIITDPMSSPDGTKKPRSSAPRAIKKVTSKGADELVFQLHGQGPISVSRYFLQTYSYRLANPGFVCVEVGSGALIPIELCSVPPGQIMRKQVPPEKTKAVLDFATQKPPERLQSIKRGLEVLQYGQSEYVRQFGLHVAQDAKPLAFNARVLQPPTLKYGDNSRQPTITPSNGSWNMIDKRFFQAASILRWVVVNYELPNRFRHNFAQEAVNSLMTACQSVGMRVEERDPIVRNMNAQGDIGKQLHEVGGQCAKKNIDPNGRPQGPTLIVVILPDGATDLYTAVKHFGDVTQGVATQCMKATKCSGGNPQYYANICLKVNVKLGGINLIPDPRSVSILTDPHNPTIVMGADVIHPAPGADGRPSFTALVANVDSYTAKYVAECRVQTSRQELIDDLKEMCKSMLEKYTSYRKFVEGKTNLAPKRIIFYRDGVSEGQFKQVLEKELPLIQAACAELNLKPAITLVVVGKRHHVRFFPQNAKDGDRSGNCPAGLVVDQEVVNPLEFDWYLQSHAGLLGTSRPAHYSVLYDENKFTPDGLQALSFALCHVYARSTRSVSIPAPVYYADIVCSRAKNHYDPRAGLDFSESATQTGTAGEDKQLEAFKAGFKPLHPNMSKVMYFS